MKTNHKVLTQSAKESILFGKKVAEKVTAGDVICLEGDLGSGKTTLLKGIAAGLRCKGEVTSPTFGIMHIYEGKWPLYHFDLYRLEEKKEIEAIGFDEFVNSKSAVVCIEWPERAGDLIPENAKKIKIEIQGENERVFSLINF